MQRIIAIFLTLLITFQSFEKMTVVVYFQAYQEYIAANLCVNRYRPELKCNGQCYLMKKLRAAEKRNSTPVAPDNQKSDFIASETHNSETLLRPTHRGSLPTAKDLVADGYIVESFHPPEA